MGDKKPNLEDTVKLVKKELDSSSEQLSRQTGEFSAIIEFRLLVAKYNDELEKKKKEEDTK